MKKRILRVFALTIILFCLQTIHAYALVSGDFGYQIVDDGVYIMLYNGNEENVVVPSEIDGYPVVGLAEPRTDLSGWPLFSTLIARTQPIKHITLPDSLTFIGNNAFKNCYDLVSIDIPESVTYIGSRAFWNCTSLTSVTIPENVTYIGREAFYGCTNLTTVNLLGGGDLVGYTFCGCENLTSVNVGDHVKTIGLEAFWGCRSLTSITFPESVERLHYNVFPMCKNLTSVVLCNPNIEIKTEGVPGSIGGILSPTFSGPENLSAIYAFKGTGAQTYAAEQEIEFVPLAQVTLNGEKLKFDMPPIIQNDRVLAPLRAIFEALDAEVGWDDTTQTVTAAKDDLQLSLRIGEPRMLLDDREITLDVPPQIVHDRTLVPVRAIGEALHANVEWDEETQTVIITTEN